MSKLAALLGGMTLTDLAKEILGSQGRGGDTELAHVNKREAALLRDQGGSGTINPNTGIREFQDDYFGPEFTQDYSGFAPDQSYMGTPQVYAPDTSVAQVDVGQPTPQVGEGQTVFPPQEISGFRTAAAEPTGYQFQPFDMPGAETMRGMFPVTGGAGVPQVTPVEQTMAETPAGGEAAAPAPGIMDDLEKLAKKYPTASKAALAAALGIPGMVRAGQARREAAKTREELEGKVAPIRTAGQELLGAGQRGELTAPQQQAVQAARAAARQDLSRRGVTSGTAAQMAENRIQELAQRFAQQNIDNGVRLIGAANSYDAQAIQMAYKMNADANAMTASYFQNLMRAFGALPTETVTTTRTA